MERRRPAGATAPPALSPSRRTRPRRRYWASQLAPRFRLADLLRVPGADQADLGGWPASAGGCGRPWGRASRCAPVPRRRGLPRRRPAGARRAGGGRRRAAAGGGRAARYADAGGMRTRHVRFEVVAEVQGLWVGGAARGAGGHARRHAMLPNAWICHWLPRDEGELFQQYVRAAPRAVVGQPGRGVVEFVNCGTRSPGLFYRDEDGPIRCTARQRRASFTGTTPSGSAVERAPAGGFGSAAAGGGGRSGRVRGPTSASSIPRWGCSAPWP